MLLEKHLFLRNMQQKSFCKANGRRNYVRKYILFHSCAELWKIHKIYNNPPIMNSIELDLVANDKAL